MHYVRISRMTDSEWVQLRSLEFSAGYFLNEISKLIMDYTYIQPP